MNKLIFVNTSCNLQTTCVVKSRKKLHFWMAIDNLMDWLRQNKVPVDSFSKQFLFYILRSSHTMKFSLPRRIKSQSFNFQNPQINLSKKKIISKLLYKNNWLESISNISSTAVLDLSNHCHCSFPKIILQNTSVQHA